MIDERLKMKGEKRVLVSLEAFQLDDITGDKAEQSNREDNKEKAGDGAGQELFAFLELFGVPAGGHNLDGGHEHNSQSNCAGDAG